ncbi:MAG: hypothetical protein Q8R11_04340 [bacterium]|nr:hypothetical protein [bacterium]
MKIALFGNSVSDLTQKLSLAHLTIVDEHPDVVICLGGDGTFLAAERQFPGVPKFCMRDGRPCKACAVTPLDETIHKLASHEYGIKEFWKVEAEISSGQTLVAVNEVQLHNDDPRHAIRFQTVILERSDRILGDPIGRPTDSLQDDNKTSTIADGAIFSSVFGSTGYFKSVTGKSISHGFGFALINPAVEKKPDILRSGDVVSIRLERGPATVYADNDPMSIPLPAGSTMTFRPSAQKIRVIVFS